MLAKDILGKKEQETMKKAIILSILLISLVVISIPTFAQVVEPTWVFMAGRVKYYGTESVGGWCGAYAEIDEWAEVHAFWANPQICVIPGNYTFHYTRLSNASEVKLNYMGKDFYVLGTWNVLKITLVYDIAGNITTVVEVIANEARGELSVTDNWSDFTIDIDNVDLILGEVYFHRITSLASIPVGDISSETPGVPDGTVDISDLVRVAKAYEDTPGIGRYDFSIDFNFDFKIDICDLTTIAANLGETY